MLHWLIPVLPSIALAIAQPPAPDLARTEFYTATVHGCRPLDLSTWRHPARQVLLDARATIAKVELCNDGKLPVFTVALPFDPDGQTADYFDKLHANLAYANGFWPYALVDTADDVIIIADIDRRQHQVTLHYEHFIDAPDAR